MNYIIFGVIVLHLVAGFGWLFYKLEIQKDKSKDKVEAENEANSEDRKI